MLGSHQPQRGATRNLAGAIMAVARPVSGALRSSLGDIAHEHEEPEARASLRD